MEIVIQFDEKIIMEAAEQAVQDTFRTGTGYSTNNIGPGAIEIARQAKEWAKEQDYKPMIAEIASRFIKEAVYQGLATAVPAAVKAEMKRMKDDGEMTKIVQQTIKEVWET